MRRRMERVVWSLCGVALVSATGCSALRDMGFESRGAQLARKYREESAELASKAAELETRLASSQSERDKIQGKLSQLEKDRAEMLARLSTSREGMASERLSKLASELGALGRPIIGPHGNKGVRLASDLLFDPGKTEIKKSAIPVLTKVASLIKQLDSSVTVFIDGHTDSDPLNVTKKLYHNNYGLGAARANAVAKKLVELGAPRERLSTRSFGQDNPIASNASPAGKAQNRRVEITFAPTTNTAARLTKATSF